MRVVAENPINKFRGMPVDENGDPLLPIPKGRFALATPHPYVELGAPYGNTSPWMLRKGVLEALTRVQGDLQKIHPGWKLLITDAYRPDPVQNHLVRREFRKQAKNAGWSVKQLVLEGHQKFEAAVHRLWARPTPDPVTQPTPHSTGAAVDITFVDSRGRRIFMGSPVDENSERSNPDHFKTLNPVVHARRELLKNLMEKHGFKRANDEWWHFSLGDQFWAFYQKENGNPNAAARYGNAALLKKPSLAATALS